MKNKRSKACLFLCFFVSLFLCGDITSCSVNGIIQQPKTPHKMKKFILSATFALACFTAQAKNEVIKNDDDKNPKNKAKVVKAEVKVAPTLACRGRFSIECSNGNTLSGNVTWQSNNCAASGPQVLADIANDFCN